MQSAELNEIAGLKYLGVIFALSFDLLIFGVDYNYMVLLGMLMVVGGVILNLLFKAYLKRRASRLTKF
jgi:drug/metabolite transporter (DMT)-like permease